MRTRLLLLFVALCAPSWAQVWDWVPNPGGGRFASPQAALDSVPPLPREGCGVGTVRRVWSGDTPGSPPAYQTYVGVIQDQPVCSWAEPGVWYTNRTVNIDPVAPLPASCTAGSSRTVNVTTGWTRSPSINANDYVYRSDPDYGAPGCDAGCVYSWQLTAQALGTCWRSQVTAPNGLHRTSCDYTVTLTGATCSGQTSHTDSSAAPPPCTGSLGYVDGRARCLDGSAAAPLPSASAATGTGVQGTGNPSAGGAPSSGQGSGIGGNARTPIDGDGGNAGGPADAMFPAGGSGSGGGSTPTEINVETCGLPGKPPCKVDETGTPNAEGAYTSATSDLEGAMTSARELVDGRQVALPASWMWADLPQGSCAPLSAPFRLGDLVADPCGSSLVLLWREVLAYALYVMGAIYIWRSATRGGFGNS